MEQRSIDLVHFMNSCASGDIAAIDKLLPKLVGLDNFGAVAVNAVLKACECGQTEVLQKLLEANRSGWISIDSVGEQALWAACTSGHSSTVQQLLALSGDSFIDVHRGTEHAFRQACAAGSTDVVRQLLALEAGRTVDVHAMGESGLVQACQGGHEGVVELLLALTGHREVDVHARNSAPLREACASGHLGVLRLLLALQGERAVDVNAQGGHAFIAACANGHMHIVEELLALTGCQTVDVQAFAQAAWVRACEFGHTDIARCLVQRLGRHVLLGGSLQRQALQPVLYPPSESVGWLHPADLSAVESEMLECGARGEAMGVHLRALEVCLHLTKTELLGSPNSTWMPVLMPLFVHRSSAWRGGAFDIAFHARAPLVVLGMVMRTCLMPNGGYSILRSHLLRASAGAASPGQLESLQRLPAALGWVLRDMVWQGTTIALASTSNKASGQPQLELPLSRCGRRFAVLLRARLRQQQTPATDLRGRGEQADQEATG